jgi:hypothetical protein
MEDADSAEVLGEAGVLCFAFLEEVILVEDGGEGCFLVYETLYGRGIVEAESANKLSLADGGRRRDYLQNMAVLAQQMN